MHRKVCGKAPKNKQQSWDSKDGLYWYHRTQGVTHILVLMCMWVCE